MSKRDTDNPICFAVQADFHLFAAFYVPVPLPGKR